MNRLQKTTSTILLLLALAAIAQGAPPVEVSPNASAKEFARELVYDHQDVDDWLGGKNRFAQYSSELGWLLNSSLTKDGIDGAACRYTYEKEGLGARRMIQSAEQPCRINAYGDSFTQCHQVSDGETWEEVLAAHLGEPIRNFGVGGWSVYQAYLRMLREEKETPANYIIFNIYSDDHYRNLDAWRSIRVARSEGGFGEVTLPYVEVNLDKGKIVEHPNPCPTPKDVYSLCNADWVFNRFKDDFVFNLMLAHRVRADSDTDTQYDALKKLSTTFGINTRVDNALSVHAVSQQIHLDAALYSSQRIVEWIEEFAKQNDKKVLYVLSYNSYEVGKMIHEGKRFDEDFLAFLDSKNLPYVDLMQKHVDDYQKYRCDVVEYLQQYFIGHYNPRGNFFHAWSIKNAVVEMLEPKPETER